MTEYSLTINNKLTSDFQMLMPVLMRTERGSSFHKRILGGNNKLTSDVLLHDGISARHGPKH